MNRGEVWWVNFNPSIGGETHKVRPAVIVSNDASNKALNRLQVIPLSSKVTKAYPSEALVTFRGRPHKAMADQLATVSKLRMRAQVGRLSPLDLDAVERAVLVQLGLR